MIEKEVVRSYTNLQIMCFLFGFLLGTFIGGKLIMEAFVHATAKWSRFWLKLFGIE